MLKLVETNDPILRTKCKKIEQFPLDQNFLKDMFDLMVKSGGCGLAAPQIGLDYHLFIIKSKESFRVFANTEIIEFGEQTITLPEGCLSLPGVSGMVSRPKKVKIRYQDQEGNIKIDYFEGMFGRIVQHEFDHCHGILFTDLLENI